MNGLNEFQQLHIGLGSLFFNLFQLFRTINTSCLDALTRRPAPSCHLYGKDKDLKPTGTGHLPQKSIEDNIN